MIEIPKKKAMSAKMDVLSLDADKCLSPLNSHIYPKV